MTLDKHVIFKNAGHIQIRIIVIRSWPVTTNRGLALHRGTMCNEAAEHFWVRSEIWNGNVGN